MCTVRRAVSSSSSRLKHLDIELCTGANEESQQSIRGKCELVFLTIFQIQRGLVRVLGSFLDYYADSRREFP